MNGYSDTIRKWAADDRHTGILDNPDGTGEVGLEAGEAGRKLAVRFTLKRNGEQINQVVLVGTDSEVICMNAQQQQNWKVPWKYGRVVGHPLLAGEQILLASEDGTVLAMDVGNGATLAATNMGEPLNWGPVVLRDQLLVAGQSGVLFLVGQPSP